MEPKAMQKLIVKREEQSGHAVYGGSSLPRILLCPASVPEGLLSEPGVTSTYAAKGTLLHKMAENVMTHGEKWIYQNSAKYKLTVADVYAVLDATEYVRGIVAMYDGTEFETFQEAHSDCTTWGLPMIKGTCDYGVRNLESADILDYKFGQGVKVYAKDNYQGLSYAAGTVRYPSSIKKIHIHIVQPFLNHYDSWTITYEEMQEIMFGHVTDQVEKSMLPEPPYNPGEKQCRFCPAAFNCVARHSHQTKNAATIFAAYEERETISSEQLADVLDACDEYSAYIKELRVHAQTECERGRGFPRRKLVAGRSTRKWKKESDVLDYLQTMGLDYDQCYTKKMVSPSQAEKLDRDFKKDEGFRDLITKPAGKPQFVKESDPRPALEPTAEASKAFADV